MISTQEQSLTYASAFCADISIDMVQDSPTKSIQIWAKWNLSNRLSTRFSCNSDDDDLGLPCATLLTNRNVPSHHRVPGFPRFRITLIGLARTSVPQPPRLGAALATGICKLVYDRNDKSTSVDSWRLRLVDSKRKHSG